MPDVFQRTVSQFGGSFSADSARLEFRDGLSAGLLVQNMSLQYAQNITRLYEVGERKIYYVGGRTQGTATLARVIGPRSLLSSYYSLYGDVCKAAGNLMIFSLSNQCEGQSTQQGANAALLGSTGKYTASYCVITTIGIAVAAADMVVNEQSSMMFSSLEYSEAGGGDGVIV